MQPQRDSSSSRLSYGGLFYSVGIVFALVLCAWPAAAQTSDPGCTSKSSGLVQLFVGIATQTVEITCPMSGAPVTTTAYAVSVGLSAPGLAFEASSKNGGASFNAELATAFLQRTSSQIAFNANLFTNCCSDTKSESASLCGLEISGGQLLSPLSNKPPGCDSHFPFDTSLTVTGNAVRIATLDQVPLADAAITGSHLLVASGSNVAPPDTNPADFFGPNARTLVGLSEANDVLWIVAVERGPLSRGITLPQPAQLMMQLGATTALNLDGGGSTSLAVDAGNGKVRLLNTPNDQTEGCTFRKDDRCERYVGASLAIHAQPLPSASR
jgi:exopolysaccharide biosynthesis protein